ncbi:MAG: peptide MFS transporter [Candidatus Aminicenantes bacterium]|nr:peptide MFS transporter [Candidatus Aminicenantes bacterium]
MPDEKAGASKPKFPSTFWTANAIELFERAAYYSMAPFMVIYLHEVLGMRPAFAIFLNGSILWGLVFFLPILSGTLADKFGFKRSLTVSFFMLSLGYFVVGNVQRFWPAFLGQRAAEAIDYTVPVVLGIILIVVGLYWFLYVQLYNLMPLFLRYIDPNAPVELYTLANPVMIVTLQMAVTRVVRRWTPVKSILLGVAVTTAGMLINVLPALFLSDPSQKVSLAGQAVPVAGR